MHPEHGILGQRMSDPDRLLPNEPSAQRQLKAPCVLTHCAFQGHAFRLRHSSMSAEREGGWVDKTLKMLNWHKGR